MSIWSEMCLSIENWTLTLLVVDELEKGQMNILNFEYNCSGQL